MNPDVVYHAYVVAALWSSTGSDEEPLDDRYGPDDIEELTALAMRADVLDFLALLELELGGVQLDDEQIGHDFWLTRNEYGAGFWDRGLGPLGDRLTELAHTYGTYTLWDDGEVVYA